MQYIKTQCRILKKKDLCELVKINYLQLLNSKSEKNNRNSKQDVADTTHWAKKIAKELDIPVIMLYQLFRKVEDRKKCKPLHSDLRESGFIEQDADQVIIVYRHEYYGFKNTDIVHSSTVYGELLIEKTEMVQLIM